MFQKDYWKMDDTEIERLAMAHNIPPISRAGEHLEHWYVDRDRIIPILVARDTALRTNITFIFATIAILLSIASFIKSFFG
jgi:hypothetical protein